MWQQWVTGIFGLWIMVGPYLGFDAGVWNALLLVSGIIIAVLGFWGAMTHQEQK